MEGQRVGEVAVEGSAGGFTPHSASEGHDTSVPRSRTSEAVRNSYAEGVLAPRLGQRKIWRNRPRRLGCALACSFVVRTSAPAQSASVQEQIRPEPLPAAAPVGAAIPAAPGVISGLVADANEVPIAGAHVALSTAGRVGSQEATTDDAGHFRFLRVAPGPFTVVVTLRGFDTVSVSGNLRPGQVYDLVPFALVLATVSVSVDAVTPEQLSLEELHIEEKQRILGLIPNFFVSYNWTAPPLTAKQKFSLSTHNVLDPGNLFLAGTVAGVEQATNAFPGYGQGATGYGKRYGAALGNLVAGTYMGGAVLPSLFHQDPRYFYKGTGTIRSRFLYAISTAVICRGDNGHRQPAFASVLGDLSAGAISNAYYAPQDRQGASLTLENGLLGIAGDAMNNVVQEFFLKKITPKAKNMP